MGQAIHGDPSEFRKFLKEEARPKLGPTGEMTEMGARAKIMIGLCNGMVAMDFGIKVDIILFTADEARSIAKSLIQRADVADAAAGKKV